MIVTPRNAWNGSVRNTSIIRNGYGTRPGTGSVPSSGQKNSDPTSTRCTCISSCRKTDPSVASYQLEKYSAHGLITNSTNVSGANESTFATRECSSASSQPRGRDGNVRSISVTGAPSARNNGTSIDRIMCWTMCALSRTVSYACLLYTSDAADDLLCVDLGGRRIIKKK